MHIGEKVNNQKYLALIILLTPLLVISLSTATFYLGYKHTSSNNNGELVIPQIETQNLNLIDAEGNTFNFSTGKWYLVHFDDFQNMPRKGYYVGPKAITISLPHFYQQNGSYGPL